MTTPRSTVGVAVLDNKLYAVGGRDGSSCLSSVEVYDPHTNKWSLASPMIKRRGGWFFFHLVIFIIYPISVYTVFIGSNCLNRHGLII